MVGSVVLQQPDLYRREEASLTALIGNSVATRLSAAILLMSGSGFAGLGYQLIWTQQFSVWLGHELIAMLAIVAAFLGGLALGAWALTRVILRSTRPALWYAGCEATMAVWAIVLTASIPTAGTWLVSWIGLEPTALRHWSIAFIGPFLLLLPSTTAMGATLPAIERVTSRLRSEGFAIGSLYAANTAGAVLGVLSCAFVLVPAFGLSNTAYICAALNAFCAVAAVALWRKDTMAAVTREPKVDSVSVPLGLLFATGALGIGYEVLVVRVLSQVMEDTVYTFAISLAVYLLGTAGGGAIYQRWLAARIGTLEQPPQQVRGALLLVVGVTCCLSTGALWFSDRLKSGASSALAGVFENVFYASHEGSAVAGVAASARIAAAIGGEAFVATIAFFFPAVAMGALFSHLCVEARAGQVGLGKALAANTFGGALAPLVFGVLLLPAIGPKLALIAITLGYLIIASLQSPRRTAQRVGLGAVAACALAMAVFAPSLAFVNVPDGGRVLRYEDGISAAVSVVEDENGVATLHIDNRQQEGSNATLLSDARQAWIPLLLHPGPHRALFLGLGTGLTAGAATWDKHLQVDAVELLPEVARATQVFAPALSNEHEPRLRVAIADARRYVRSAGPAYDVIVADLFHPARNGAGALYTVEHFAAVRNRLASGGLFCQWLPVHQLDLDSLRSIVAAFMEVYPNAAAVLATNSLDTPVLGLVAQPSGNGLSVPLIRARLTHVYQAARLRELNLDDDLALLGTLVSGASALHRFAAGAPINTDDHPFVIHRAPFTTYARDSEPRDRLLALLHSFEIRPEEVLAATVPGDDAPIRERLIAYWSARSHFIEVGTHVQPTSDVRAMLGQVRAPLLQILRTSPDFRPAYDPLLSMAAALSQRDAAGARALLVELADAQPARGEARLLLQQLAAFTSAAGASDTPSASSASNASNASSAAPPRT